MRSTRRRVILTMLLGAAGSAVAPRAALATLIPPGPRHVRRYKPVGTVLWLDNWLYRVITPNDGIAVIPVRCMPTYVVDQGMVPTVNIIVRYDIRFLDQRGGECFWGVDSEPGKRTEALRVLYRGLAERDIRIMQLLPLEVPPSAAMITR